MQTEELTQADIPVLAPEGRLDTNTAPTFEAELLAALAADNRLIVDLAGVDYISSAGLRIVLMGAKRARQAGGMLVLCGLAPSIEQVFSVSGFLKILITAATRQQAARRITDAGGA